MSEWVWWLRVLWSAVWQYPPLINANTDNTHPWCLVWVRWLRVRWSAPSAAVWRSPFSWRVAVTGATRDGTIDSLVGLWRCQRNFEVTFHSNWERFGTRVRTLIIEERLIELTIPLVNPFTAVGLYTDRKICEKKWKFKNRLFTPTFGKIRHMDLGILGKKTKMKMKLRFLS